MHKYSCGSQCLNGLKGLEEYVVGERWVKWVRLGAVRVLIFLQAAH